MFASKKDRKALEIIRRLHGAGFEACPRILPLWRGRVTALLRVYRKTYAGLREAA
jgi:hypothetical protein